jgi:ATP phosphoribosyltransferase
VIIFIIPKNSGLEFAREISSKYLAKETIIVRGEDVPLFVLRLLGSNKKVIGITGEDLFKEFLLENRSKDIKIIERVVWDDNSFVFNKPTLCLLGPKNRKIESLPKNLKICINRKYKELAKKYCTNILENKGYTIEKIYVSGGTEEFFVKGIADLVIDIVCSGKSADKADLVVYDKLFESDIVVVGGKNDKNNNRY